MFEIDEVMAYTEIIRPGLENFRYSIGGLFFSAIAVYGTSNKARDGDVWSQ
jgi:hypothetical protein